jgi:selenocysteine-specific elongation factor
MTRLVVGVLGHVDHGKTSLVRTLTGIDTDRLPEEKQRGISIALGFAHLQLDKDSIVDLIDMPGHERFVRTMIAGATGIDAMLLVVAANEGIKPQTVEHIDIAALLGLRRAVVAITKVDLVTAEQAAHVADQTQRLLKQSGFNPLTPVMTSALEEKGKDELQRAFKELMANARPRNADGLMYLPIDRAFSIAGHGAVVTGTLRGARIASEDTLELLPSKRSVRVRAVHVHGRRVDHAMPGQRVALNLRDIEMTELWRGMALAAPDTLPLSEWLTVTIRAVDNAASLKNGAKLRALIGTDELDVRLRLLNCDVLDPAQTAFAQLHLTKPIAVPAGEHAILRLNSPSRTVAGGKVLEPNVRRRRRNDIQTLQRLEALRTLPPTAMIAAEAQRAGAAGTTLQHLSHLSALATSRVTELLKTIPVVSTRSGLVVWKADMDKLLARISALLAAHATGLSQSKLLASLPGTSTAVLDEALVQLLATRNISERSSKFLLARPQEDEARAHREAEIAASIAAEIAEKLRRAGLTPLNPSEIVTSAQTKRAVDQLLRNHVLVRAVDRDKHKELLFHRDAIETAKQILEPLLKHPQGLLVTEIAAALGISRKYCMPLLDHLDTIRFTRRINDRRVRA